MKWHRKEALHQPTGQKYPLYITLTFFRQSYKDYCDSREFWLNKAH